MAAIDHLHNEAQVLPVSNELSLICTQYLASALRPDHPSHLIVTSPPGPRNMKETLQSRFLPQLTHLLSNGITPEEEFKTILKEIHTEAVEVAIQSYPNNKVLDAPAPCINEEEKELPRTYRTTLSQLRSGYCRGLNSYNARIGETTNSLCPSCNAADHTSRHLFSCPSHPTNLDVEDLWHQPVRTAAFLSTLPFLSWLPELPRPPPEPPPGVAASTPDAQPTIQDHLAAAGNHSPPPDPPSSPEY